MLEKRNISGESGSCFEQGPIRPPNEAGSLLIRVTRNCPWNRCTFCPVYKGETFSRRPVADVLGDIDQVAGFVDDILFGDRPDSSHGPRKPLEPHQWQAYSAAHQWVYQGDMAAVFLQDANSLHMPVDELVRILRRIKQRFPRVERITSYARSRTIVRLTESDLMRLRGAGLNRLHLGLESGSDRVLNMVRKGATRKEHISAGLLLKAAGMEVSEYIMPGLGGREMSREHALETADALNRIDPHFIRLRTLAVVPGTPLYDQQASGDFFPCSEMEILREIRLLVENLEKVNSVLASDHILNLLPGVEGRLPADREAILSVLDEVLEMDSEDTFLFQVGRRLGMLEKPDQVRHGGIRQSILEMCARMEITPENADETIRNLLTRYL